MLLRLKLNTINSLRWEENMESSKLHIFISEISKLENLTQYDNVMQVNSQR